MAPVLPRREVSRIEGFSDAVFGFALTLLVVSLEVPADYRGLADILSRFLPFAVTFATVVWIWFEHYLYFRKFGLEDGLVVALNAVLLFVVLFYVYPLKFVFSNLIPGVTTAGFTSPGAGFAGMTLAEARHLLAAYSMGFVAVFGVYVLMYLHACRRAAGLGLDRLGVFDARAGLYRHLVSVAIGMLAFVLAWWAPPRVLSLSGLSFSLLGPAHALNGYLSGRARDRLAASLASPPPEPDDTVEA